ncbi:FGGY family of carbohydrate kinase [Pyronema omphalodes]|nr:FGGY family of carbohydrate kinase [Pyronema omphalodes]
MTATYLGFDLSSSGLKCLAVTPDLKAVHEESITFDKDLPSYGVSGGVLKNETENEVYAPVAMWIEALDLLLQRMKDNGFDFSTVKGISGAGQQHGSVYWSDAAEGILSSLDASKPLVEQLSPHAFTHPFSPNWQDHSTQAECEQFEATAGSGDNLAHTTGSRAHHRFTGPQIKRFLRLRPEIYESTPRISLVSSFLCSLFLGKIAPLDISDVCGMNLWSIPDNSWDESLLSLTAAGSPGGAASLKKKLGAVSQTPGENLGGISPFFTTRYGFSSSCTITPFTGDNPSTILSLPLRPLDAILSLGTSTTLLMVTKTYKTSTEYHMFNHPTTRGLYMFMLCYCNGSLAREELKDTLNSHKGGDWNAFNHAVTSSPVPHKPSSTTPAKLGLYFPLPENIPNIPSGTWRFSFDGEAITETSKGWNIPYDDARCILESQALSMRLRSEPLLEDARDRKQPGRLYVVGGGSRNEAIVQVMAKVLGPMEGVFALDVGSNACALGAAYLAAWAGEARAKPSSTEAGVVHSSMEAGVVPGATVPPVTEPRATEAKGAAGVPCTAETKEPFEDWVQQRWDEASMVKKIGEGYQEGVWEAYGELMKGLKLVEELVVERDGN